MRYLLALLLFLPTLSHAQHYIGVDLFSWSYDEDFVEEASATGFRARIGTALHEHFAVEAHFATGGSDTVFVNIPGCCSGNIEIELEHLFSVMLRPQYSIAPKFNVFGLVGMSSGELKATGPGGSITGSDSGLSVGFGAEYAVTDGVWIGGDYVSYLGDDDYDFTAFALGARLTF